MQVQEAYGIEAAPRARGHVVVIDVLRAFTTAAYAFSRGTEKIILVSTAEEAFQLKKQNPEFLLVGESGGRMIPGFDYGNSPEQMEKLDLDYKTIVLRSSSGTQGVVHAREATQVWLGSLVVARATVEMIRRRQPELLTLLAMGAPEGPDGDEDVACSNYMRALALKEPIAEEGIVRRVRKCPAGLQATDPKVDWKTPGDLECAVQVNRFHFAMPVQREAKLLIARPQFL